MAAGEVERPLVFAELRIFGPLVDNIELDVVRLAPKDAVGVTGNTFFEVKRSWAEFLTADAANLALAESTVNLDVGCELNECSRFNMLSWSRNNCSCW